MYHGPLPLPVMILGIIDFCADLRKHRRKSHFASRRFYVPENNYTDVKQIIAEHQDWKSVQIEVSVLDPVKAQITTVCPLGYPVSLSKVDGDYYLTVDRRHICCIFPPYHSDVLQALDDKMPYEAYITDREFEASGFYDFFTITVFYR